MSETGEQMIEAAKKGDVQTVKKLLEEGADVHYAGEYNRTALHWAAWCSAADVCEVLLAHRANVDAVDEDRRTALHMAAIHSAADVCEVLIAHRANVDAVDKYNQTALHYAARWSAADVCEVLIAHRANVDAVDDRNRTALHWAAMGSAADVCEVLLAHRANVEAVDHTQRTPMHYACKEYNNASPSDNLKRLQLIIILLRAKADIASKDKDGKTPLDLLSASKRKTIQQEYDNFTTVHKLMQGEGRPMDVVKICLCGDPAAGKTTIKSTLIKKLSLLTKVGRKLGMSKKREVADDGGYVRTPGINVSRQSVPDAGEFVLWDCAGQKEYSLTHGMFLGATAQSIFVVMYDLTSPRSKASIIEYWLPFIRAMHGKGEERPQVVLVGSHFDKVNPRQGKREGLDIIKTATERFHDTLEIIDTIILVDAREGYCEGMADLKAVLKRRRKEMIKDKTVPKLCDEVQALIKPLRDTAVPIIGWDEYLHLVKTKYGGIDEDTLKLVTGFLHLQGEIYWAKFTKKEDQLILNTQWFTTEIIGAAFAGDEFRRQFKPLPDQSCYTLEELREFFPEMDTSRLLALLDDMDLLHVTSDERYLLPGKLPLASLDVDAWDTHGAYELKGRSIKCVHQADIFNPLVFPALQKKMLDIYRDSCQVWQSTVLCKFGRVEVTMKLTKHKRAIQVVVKCPTRKDRKVSHEKLEDVVELIQSELFQKSKGTIVQFGYMSPNALRQHQDLEEVLSFSQEELIEAEEWSGVIGPDEEDITQILFNGYDDMFLRQFGLNCRYDWLPVSAADRCFHRLDESSEWEEDYRAVGQALGIPEFEIKRLANSSGRHESLTTNIINTWCTDQKRKMSIGMLQELLSRLSLFHNADALISIDEVVEEYTSHLMKSEALTGHEASSDVYASQDADSAFNVDVTGVTDKLVRWRLVLKRRWEVIVCDLTTNGITSSLDYLPERLCQVLEDRPLTQEQRQQKAENLLKKLLHWNEDRWPDDFLQGLRETGQSPLANALSEEYHKVEKEEEERCKKRRLTQRAFYKSIKHEEGHAAAAATGTG